MASQIQLKRGLKNNLPTLNIAEPAFTIDTNEFFVGNGIDNIEFAKKDYVDNQINTIADNTKLISFSYDQYATTDGQTIFEIPYEYFNANTDTLIVFNNGKKGLLSDYIITEPVEVDGVITKGYITLKEGRALNEYVGMLILKNVITGNEGAVSGDLITIDSLPQDRVKGLTNSLNLKAPLASPDLIGIPTAPTAATGTNTTQIATTAFVTAHTSDFKQHVNSNRLTASQLNNTTLKAGFYTNTGDGILNGDGSTFKTGWWHVTVSYHLDNNGYGHQTIYPLNIAGEGIYERSANGTTWGAWRAVITASGGTMTGILTAQSNASYGTRQVRNIIISTADANLGAMQNGDIWIKIYSFGSPVEYEISSAVNPSHLSSNSNLDLINSSKLIQQLLAINIVIIS